MGPMTTCLWFDGRAEEAADFYVAAFRACGREAALGKVLRWPPVSDREGKVLTVSFTLDGSEFVALDGGPQFTFSPAVSIMVRCGDQAEVDRFWDRLMADGGSPSKCGWLTDRFGLSWQVAPEELLAMHHDPDRERAARVMRAMMTMVKLDLAELRKAYEG